MAVDRWLLHIEIGRLEARVALLEEHLRYVLDRAVPVPTEEPGEESVGWRIYLTRAEMRAARDALACVPTPDPVTTPKPEEAPR